MKNMFMNKDELRIAVPSKGRLKDQSIEILRKAGLQFRASGRQLFARCRDTGVMVIFSHAQDIPSLVQEGIVDLGITGSDLVIEKEAGVEVHIQLGFGKCRLSFASHVDSDCTEPADFSGRILGTKFVHLAERYFSENAIKNVKIVEINGAVEVMVLLGLVDGILDVVETGSSLREHDLLERASILEAQAVLIGNSKPRDAALRDTLLRRIEGVLLADRYSMLEYNCPVDKVAAAKAITPGYSSPTIQHTDSPDWVAVKGMVEKKAVQRVIDELEAVGCHAIIETEVKHCRL